MDVDVVSDVYFGWYDVSGGTVSGGIVTLRIGDVRGGVLWRV